MIEQTILPVSLPRFRWMVCTTQIYRILNGSSNVSPDGSINYPATSDSSNDTTGDSRHSQWWFHHRPVLGNGLVSNCFSYNPSRSTVTLLPKKEKDDERGKSTRTIMAKLPRRSCVQRWQSKLHSQCCENHPPSPVHLNPHPQY